MNNLKYQLHTRREACLNMTSDNNQFINICIFEIYNKK